MTRKRRTGTALAGSALLLALLPLISGPVSAAPGFSAEVQVSNLAVSPFDLDVAANAARTTAAVWVEGANADAKVMLATRAPGTTAWSAPVLVAATGDTAPDPVVAVGPDGEIIVLYRSPDGLRSKVRNPAGTLGSAAPLPGAGITGSPQLEMAPDGTASAVWTTFNVIDSSVVTSTRPAGGSWGSATTLGQATGDVRLSMGPAGHTAVSWLTGSGSVDAMVRIRPAGSSTFAAAEMIGPGGYEAATAPQVLVTGTGITRAIFTRDVGNGLRVVRSLRTNNTGTWSVPLSESSEDSAALVAVMDPSGVMYAAWSENLGPNNARINTLRFTEGSSVLEVLPGSAPFPTQHHALALNRDNVPVLSWGLDGEDTLFYSVRSDGTSTGTWGTGQPSFAKYISTPPVWTFTSNAELSLTAINRPQLADGGTSRVSARILDTRGPVLALTTPKDRTKVNVNAIPLSWTLTDLSPSTTDVQVYAAVWNADFGTRTTFQSGLTTTKTSFPALPGRTYCFLLRGTDTHGNRGNFSNTRCAVTPVDDRTMTPSNGWAKSSSSAFYRSTFRQSTIFGANLTLSNANGKSFALLASTGPGQGTVAIYLGTTKLKTISLAGTTHKNRVIIPIKDFTSAKRGKLTIKIISDGKRVRIDGLYVGQ